MEPLNKTYEMLQSYRLPVEGCGLMNGKVYIDWTQEPTEYERMVAQSCTMYQPCIHHWS